MKNTYYIHHLSSSIREGGMARNKAFYDKISSSEIIILNVSVVNLLKRFFGTVKIISKLLFMKKKHVLIHQGTLLIIFPVFFLRINFIRKILFLILKNIAKRNKLIVEVNDLIYEQSIDLELKVDDFFRVLQLKLYSLEKCNYIFASNEMESYACSKYSIHPKNSSVIINGAPKVKDCADAFKNERWMDNDKNKYVYAGSLNRGRQIEDLLNIFRCNDNNLLVILGNEGEWLNDIKLPNNIIYLGNYEESEAHYIVSKCDIGLIPYNAHRFYYNMCYPTKASFYLTAGLPVLSTPLKELQNIFEDKGVFLFNDFEDWKGVIEGIDKNVIAKMKREVDFVKDNFYWESLLSKFEY